MAKQRQSKSGKKEPKGGKGVRLELQSKIEGLKAPKGQCDVTPNRLSTPTFKAIKANEFHDAALLPPVEPYRYGLL